MNGYAHEHAVDLDTAFDFLNTRELESGAPVDHLQTAGDAVQWLAGHGLLHAEQVDDVGRNLRVARRGEAALARIRAVRDALREINDAIVEERPPAATAIDEVNRALRAREVTQLEPSGDGVRVGHRHEGDPIDDALARLAMPIVHEIATGHADRLRVCANETCRWAFYDASPTGRRRWCDMATCGNRAKARRHRERQRAALSN